MLTHLGQKNVHLIGHAVHLLPHGVERWQWVTTMVYGVTQVMIHIEVGVIVITKVLHLPVLL